ncbi:SAUR-like auxin-responsive protein family [Euphorbia peplus]|nr:SAUR-like auxin-responsive protein family [Euphorbia peplus]
MDMDRGKGMSGKENNLISKTWKRCKSIGRGTKKTPATLTEKSKSWPRLHYLRQPEDHRRVAPEGCFSVYVGPEKQRFVIKTKYANHPLFKILLEEAESEYGYNPEGPLALPCNVEIFWNVLGAMDYSDEIFHRKGFCGFSKNHVSSYQHLTSPSLVN